MKKKDNVKEPNKRKIIKINIMFSLFLFNIEIHDLEKRLISERKKREIIENKKSMKEKK